MKTTFFEVPKHPKGFFDRLRLNRTAVTENMKNRRRHTLAINNTEGNRLVTNSFENMVNTMKKSKNIL